MAPEPGPSAGRGRTQTLGTRLEPGRPKAVCWSLWFKVGFPAAAWMPSRVEEGVHAPILLPMARAP